MPQIDRESEPPPPTDAPAVSPSAMLNPLRPRRSRRSRTRRGFKFRMRRRWRRFRRRLRSPIAMAVLFIAAAVLIAVPAILFLRFQSGRGAETIHLDGDPAAAEGGGAADPADKTKAQPPAKNPRLALLEAIVELKRLNPGYDGKYDAEYADSRLDKLTISGEKLTDLSPLAALTTLQKLNLSVPNVEPRRPGAPRSGMLTDLTPLKGLKLKVLFLWGARVRDLSPLAALPLEELACGGTEVTDLSPLAGLKLTMLQINETGVSDLAPLKGLPLKRLYFGRTKVSDLSPLAGMKLTHVNCSESPVASLAPLAGMPIEQLMCQGTKAADLAPLKGMPLQRIHCDIRGEADQALLRSFPRLESINQKTFDDALEAGGPPKPRPEG